jgi:alcohol dehydrogenase class IV
MRYEFTCPAQIIVGPGTAADLPGDLTAFGRRGLLVESRGAVRRAGPAGQLGRQLQAAGLIAVNVAVEGEPSVESVQHVGEQARDAGCQYVVAIGGGSVIDAGKAAAALLANHGSPLTYLEVIGEGRALEQPALPLIAVPTTAGAGSEATRNAVLRSAQHGAKASLRHPSLMPRLALVDPTLATDLPQHVRASCGMDALTQLIEAFVSRRAGPLTDGLCREGLALAARSLQSVYATPTEAAQYDMAMAALLSGMALANAGLGAVHGIAAPLGGMADAAHGAVCAALLAPVTQANLRVAQGDPAGAAVVARYGEVARILGSPSAEALPAWLAALARELAIPGLATYGLQRSAIAENAERALEASSTRSNPVTLTAHNLATAIEQAW